MKSSHGNIFCDASSVNTASVFVKKSEKRILTITEFHESASHANDNIPL